MSQTPALIDTLKQQLKANGKTYADVATTLQISEASVKRLFATHSFTLQRLEQVCHLIDLQLSELITLMDKNQPQLKQLTSDQERDIVNDPLLLLITVSVINGHSYHELLNDIKITQTQLIQKLAQLDRLRIIDLLPNNRIKLLVAPNFRWLANGPIQQYFQKHVERAFFNTTFANTGEKLLVLNGSLSEESNKQLQRKMDKLAREFNELMKKDHAIPSYERCNNTLVLAVRDWHYGLFEGYRKN